MGPGFLYYRGFPGGSDIKESACTAEDPGLIPGSRRSPGEGNGNSLQYSCLEKPMDSGGLQSTEMQGAGHNWAPSIIKSGGHIRLFLKSFQV